MKTNARHRKLIRRIRYSVIYRPMRESESRATRLARWAAELTEGFLPPSTNNQSLP